MTSGVRAQGTKRWRGARGYSGSGLAFGQPGMKRSLGASGFQKAAAEVLIDCGLSGLDSPQSPASWTALLLLSQLITQWVATWPPTVLSPGLREFRRGRLECCCQDLKLQMGRE